MYDCTLLMTTSTSEPHLLFLTCCKENRKCSASYKAHPALHPMSCPSAPLRSSENAFPGDYLCRKVIFCRFSRDSPMLRCETDFGRNTTFPNTRPTDDNNLHWASQSFLEYAWIDHATSHMQEKSSSIWTPIVVELRLQISCNPKLTSTIPPQLLMISSTELWSQWMIPGECGHRSHYLSHAKRALYHLS